MNPVLCRYRDSESVIKHMDGYTPGEGWEPLYSQEQVDNLLSMLRSEVDKAATAATQERCAQAVEELDRQKWFPSQRDFATACVDAIRKGGE